MNFIAQLAGALHPAFADLSGVPLFVFVAVTLATLTFLGIYVVRGTIIWRALGAATQGVKSSSTEAGRAPPAPNSLTGFFAKEPLRHLWAEYSDSVHTMRVRVDGELQLQPRATAPAEAFFTREALVDAPLYDDFVRHLPGVLTGLGIIGTFAGLLVGLNQFDPTTTATAVAGLKPLLGGVQHAFVASAYAIGAAMLVVFISRFVLTALYKRADALVQAIDAAYQTGASAEYLSRLVDASERGSLALDVVKDSIANDLKQILQDLTARQIEAQANQFAALKQAQNDNAKEFAGVLTDGLKGLADGIGKSVSTAPAAAVDGMLERLITSLTAKLDDTFGRQVGEIKQGLDKSMETMARVELALSGLVKNIETSTTNATTQMTEQMGKAIEESSRAQREAADAMKSAVEAMQAMLGKEAEARADATDKAMQDLLAKLESSMSNMVTAIGKGATDIHGRNTEVIQTAVGGMSDISTEVAKLLERIAENNEKVSTQIGELQRVSTDAIEGMNQGAGKMHVAADRFSTAGDSVTQAIDRSASVSERLVQTSQALQTASAAALEAVDRHGRTADQAHAQLLALTQMVDQAQGQTGITEGLVSDLERIAQQLKIAEAQSKDYFDQVNAALEAAFKSFTRELTEGMQSTLSVSDGHLKDSVGQLAAAANALMMATRPRK